MTAIADAPRSHPLPPSPPKGLLFGHLPELRDLLSYYARCKKEYGDVFRLSLAGWTSIVVSHPDLIETVTQNSDDGEVLLGDIVLAHGVCVAEAAERGIATETHATHLLVHGVLHLLGYDHMQDDEAEAMEAIERDALASLGIDDPYLVRED